MALPRSGLYEELMCKVGNETQLYAKFYTGIKWFFDIVYSFYLYYLVGLYMSHNL